MTDIEPGPMVSRQAHTPAVVTPAATPAHVGAFKPENLQMAEAIAKASDVLPYSYKTRQGVGQPGAVLLALDYAQRNELALVDVFAEVAFQGGKPIVGARMQRKLASRFGCITRLIDSSPEHATVAVFDADGKKLGESTYRLETAKALGICFEKDGQTFKGPWRDPENMLYHRATTRVLDRYGPSELAGTFRDPDDIGHDPIAAVLASPTPSSDAPADAIDVETTTPPAEEPPAAPSDPAGQPDATDLKAALKAAGKTQAAALKRVQGQLGDEFATLDLIAADSQATDLVLGWLDA